MEETFDSQKTIGSQDLSQLAELQQIPEPKRWGFLRPLEPLTCHPVDLTLDKHCIGRQDGSIQEYGYRGISRFEVSSDPDPSCRWQGISRRHCYIERVDDIVYLKPHVRQPHLKVTKCFVNGELVQEQCVLRNGAEISFGTSTLKMFVYFRFGGDFDLELPESLRSDYVVSKLMGEGTFGKVYLAVHIRDAKDRRALKVLRKTPSTNVDTLLQAKNEIALLKEISHPFIVELLDISFSERDWFLSMELMEGGELFDRIQNPKKFGLYDENVSRFLFFQVADAVRYLHSKKIVHRDLKPENILLKDKAILTIVKVADFGLSYLPRGESILMKSMCGTTGYMAPEIAIQDIRKVQLSYTNKVDVWSLGVILFTMNFFYNPFNDDTTGDVSLNAVMEGRIIQYSTFKSRSCKMLKRMINSMLQPVPETRFSIEEVFNDPWMNADATLQDRLKRLLTSNDRVVLSDCSNNNDAGEAAARKRVIPDTRMDLTSPTRKRVIPDTRMDLTSPTKRFCLSYPGSNSSL